MALSVSNTTGSSYGALFTFVALTCTIHSEGGAQSTPIGNIRNNDPRVHLFTGGDSSHDLQCVRPPLLLNTYSPHDCLRRAAVEEANLRAKLATIDNIIHGLRKRVADWRTDTEANDRQGKAVTQEIRELKRKKGYLEEQSKEEAPVEVAALEQQRKDHLAEKETIMLQFDDVSP